MDVEKQDTILWASNELSRSFKRKGELVSGFDLFSLDRAKAVRAYHETMPQYAPTPLVHLRSLSAMLGCGDIFVKDESHRFGLNAFKALGASYAAGSLIASRLGIDPDKIDLAQISSQDAHKIVGDLTFATATDGNHGRGVAWTAKILGHRAVVYMPKGSSKRRVDAITSEGADVSVTDKYYDDCVVMMRDEAMKNGWLLIQDTAWDGYTEIPRLIMCGYATMVTEAVEQMQAMGHEPPTHVFIQAGVGSMAAAVAAFMRAIFPDSPPKIIIVESNQADCFYKSCAARDGEPHRVGGALDTIMAGLACGEPSIDAFAILSGYANAFVSCPDKVTARGMRILASPLRGDAPIVSGESGAVTAGLMSYIASDIHLSALKVMLGLSERSRVLLFSTEGDTDPERYRSIVWDGAWPSYEKHVI